MKSNTVVPQIFRTCLLTGAAVLLVGCASGRDTEPLSYRGISRDLTPELQNSADRPVDIDRRIAFANNQNVRSMWDDLGRVFYTDHPSRISPLPVSMTSGWPR